jgi:hypothetical protein
LRSQSAVWASTLFTSTLTLLGIATLAAAFGKGRRRAFWVGAAFCGWLYILLWCSTEIRPNLTTTLLIDFAYPGDKFNNILVKGNIYTTRLMYPTWNAMVKATKTSFFLVGHSLFALLASLGGGLVAWVFASTIQTEATGGNRRALGDRPNRRRAASLRSL